MPGTDLCINIFYVPEDNIVRPDGTGLETATWEAEAEGSQV